MQLLPRRIQKCRQTSSAVDQLANLRKGSKNKVRAQSKNADDKAAATTSSNVEKASAYEFSEFSWKEIPTFAALVGAASIALSVSRELGFFWALDLNLLSLFSLQDVLRNSLYLVPVTLLSAAIGMPFVSEKLRFSERFLGGIFLCGLATMLVSFYWPILFYFGAIIMTGAVWSWLRLAWKVKVTSDLLLGDHVLIVMFGQGVNEGQRAVRSAEK